MFTNNGTLQQGILSLGTRRHSDVAYFSSVCGGLKCKIALLTATILISSLPSLRMNVTHGNVSVDDDTEPQLSMTHRVVFVCLWAVGLLLNIGCAPIVGWVMWKKPTWPIILLFILTLTDTMVVVFGISVSVASVADSTVLWNMSPLCTYQSVVINTWYLYSYIVVLAISLDRYLAVCHPFVYNKQLTNKAFVVKGVVTLLVAGLAMLVVAALPLMIGADIVPVKPGLFCFFDWTSQTAQNRLVTIINVGITFLTVGLLLFFTTATCFGIYKIVQSSRSRDGNMSLTMKVNTQSDNDMEVKFAKLMIVVIILFAACNLPFVVYTRYALTHNITMQYIHLCYCCSSNYSL